MLHREHRCTVTKEMDYWAVGVLAFELAFYGYHPCCSDCNYDQIDGKEPYEPIDIDGASHARSTPFGWMHKELRNKELLEVGGRE